jgi:hypothetical protein
VTRAVLVTLIAASSAHAGELSIGVRSGPQWLYLEGDGPPSDLRGFVLGVDGALPVARRISVAAVVDGSIYTQRSDRLPPGRAATSLATFVELRLDTDPEGPVSARIDLGTGFRWLRLPLDSGPTDSFRAWEPLRLRVGPAWRASREIQVALQAGIGFGLMVSRNRDGTCSLVGTCADSLYNSDTQSSAHFVTELVLSVRGWP